MTQMTTLPLEPTVRIESEKRPLRRLLIISVGAVLLFIMTYVLAWFQAYNLSMTYLQDADQSFEAGRYLDALVGYSTFDRPSGRYLHHGGYMQIQSIWKSDFARPLFPSISKAQERIDLIVNQHITIEDAEQFVQENIGQSNPYLGVIYLRLGELYEAKGQIRDAEDIYQSISDLFKDEPELIERAKAHLERLKNNAG